MFPFRVFTGAIFTEEQKDSSTELAFKYAVYRINKDKTVLPKTTLVYDIQYVPKDDSFRTAKIGKYLSLLLVVLFSRLIDQPIGSVHMEWIWKANTVEYLRSDKEPSRELELRDFEYNDRSQLIPSFPFSACRQLEFGVQAIFGPCDPLLGGHIQSICEALDIPHIEARIEYESFKEFSINLHPSQQHINSAYKDLMSFLNWTKVAIIYEEDFGKSNNVFRIEPLVADSLIKFRVI